MSNIESWLGELGTAWDSKTAREQIYSATTTATAMVSTVGGGLSTLSTRHAFTSRVAGVIACAICVPFNVSRSVWHPDSDRLSLWCLEQSCYCRCARSHGAKSRRPPVEAISRGPSCRRRTPEPQGIRSQRIATFSYHIILPKEGNTHREKHVQRESGTTKRNRSTLLLVRGRGWKNMLQNRLRPIF